MRPVTHASAHLGGKRGDAAPPRHTDGVPLRATRRAVAAFALAACCAVVTAAALVVSCRSDSPRGGRWVTCNCPYLTDFDDVAKHSVDVCVPPGADATELGRDCAARVAHGPPDACKCEGPREPCDGRETCRSNELK